MQIQGNVQGQTAERPWMQHRAENLRQAVLRGQTSKVNQLLGEGVPLVSDKVGLQQVSRLSININIITVKSIKKHMKLSCQLVALIADRTVYDIMVYLQTVACRNSRGRLENLLIYSFTLVCFCVFADLCVT